MDNEFSLKNLQSITKIAHEKYIEKQKGMIFMLISSEILSSANKGFYRFTTFETIEWALKEYWENITDNEWNLFIENIKIKFSEISIIINEKYPYWIDFDWSGDK